MSVVYIYLCIYLVYICLLFIFGVYVFNVYLVFMGLFYIVNCII